MTEPQNSPAATSEAAQTGRLSRLQEAVEAARAESAPGLAAEQGAGEQPTQPDDDEVEIEVADGVTERVSRQEIAKVWRDRGDLEAQRRVTQQELERSIQARQLFDHVQKNWTQEQREAFAFMLNDPDTVTQMLRHAQRQQNSYDDDYQQGSPAPAQLPQQVLQRLSQVERFMQQQAAQQAAIQLEANVDAALDAVSTFSPKKTAGNPLLARGRDFARRALLAEAKSNPNLDLRRTAAEYATAYAQDMAKVTAPPTPQDVRGRAPAKRQRVTGADLAQGKGAHMLYDRLMALDRDRAMGQ